MNVIPRLSAVALPEIHTAAALVNLEIVEDAGLFTVYRGGHWHTSCASAAVLLEIVNQHIEQHNEHIVTAQAKADQVKAATAGFTLAAVLDQRGAVIGAVMVSPSARFVTLVDGVMGMRRLMPASASCRVQRPTWPRLFGFRNCGFMS